VTCSTICGGEPSIRGLAAPIAWHVDCIHLRNDRERETVAMSISVAASAGPTFVDLPVQPLTETAFAPFGQVIAARADGETFGPRDAQLELSRGTPRFYIMRLKNRPLAIRQITRHCNVTQCLASVGGVEWLLAVAPPGKADDPGAEPALDGIVAFRVPAGVGVKLHRGTWHAGPYFAADTVDFFNLELSDTNIVDHDNCDLAARYGTVLTLKA
jgi:ureidoglycolate hydrolase